MECQEQERRSAAKGGERETAPQVEQAEGDGGPASASDESQTGTQIRPSPLDSPHTTSAPPPPHPIQDFSRILYPEGISSPNAELNANAKGGKYRYDRKFLMQFQAVCKDKPLTLAPLHDIGLGFLDPSSLPAATSATTGNRWRKQIGRHQSHTISVEFIDRSPPAAATTTGSRGNNRNTPVLPAPMPPSASEALIFGVTTPSGGVNNSPPKKPRPGKPSKTKSAPSVDTAQLAKFIRSASSEQVDIAVESLLGKLSMENVDVISDDITWWASKSEESGRTLGQVVCLVVKSAVENPTQSYAYARLCHKTMTQIGTKVRDEVMISGWNKNATGSLFHTRLLATCQEHFDKDWNVNGATTAIFDRGTVSNEAAHVVSENAEGGVHETEFAGLDSESNDRQAKKQAKRLGLIRFIGELFRVRMVKESIIREYLNKLVAADNPRDQRIEGLCELLKQVGSRLDTPKNRTEMDAYFRCLNERGEGLDTSPHILAMLQDIQERRWE